MIKTARQFSIVAVVTSALAALSFFFVMLTASSVAPAVIKVAPRVAGVKIAATIPFVPSSTPITVQFFGDIMLDRQVATMMGQRGLSYLFSEIASTSPQALLDQADLQVANLEGPFAPRRITTTKTIAFRFDPRLAGQLKKYGFDVVSLANNHTLDMGVKNAAFTETTLDDVGLGHFGHQTKEGDVSLWTGQVGAEKVALLGFNNTDHKLNQKEVEKAIDKAKQLSRYVIVYMHWGNEYKLVSNQAQRDLAHWFINQGVSAVVGAHPHVVQEIEVYQGKPIVYSLGNFIFDQYFSKDTQEGLSVRFALYDGAITAVELFPIYSVKSKVFSMTGERQQKFLEALQKRSRLGDKKITGNVLTL